MSVNELRDLVDILLGAVNALDLRRVRQQVRWPSTAPLAALNAAQRLGKPFAAPAETMHEAMYRLAALASGDQQTYDFPTSQAAFEHAYGEARAALVRLRWLCEAGLVGG